MKTARDQKGLTLVSVASGGAQLLFRKKKL